MKYLVVLGRQPELSLAELMSLYGDSVQPLEPTAALITNQVVDFDRLGGSPKLAELVVAIPQTDPNSIIDAIAEHVLPLLPTGKLAVGLSWYGFGLTPRDALAYGLTLKKLWRKAGLSLRIVPGNPTTAAQIEHNTMLVHGADIVVVRAGQQSYIGLTRAVQAIGVYAQRDHGRPARSARVGMLPPKLAQIMINLANPGPGSTILDPFCGTGVILQEALLMGYDAYGSDIASDLVEMSRTNLAWLRQAFPGTASRTLRLETGDATRHTWQPPLTTITTEGYLGPGLTKSPDQTELDRLRRDATSLTLQFLNNLRPQLLMAQTISLSLPAWPVGRTVRTLGILDQISALGYTQTQFLPAYPELIYHRPGQFVARQLVILRSS